MARLVVKPIDMRISARFRGAVGRETDGWYDCGTVPWRGVARNRRMVRLRHGSVARLVAEPTAFLMEVRFRGKNEPLRLLLPVLMV